MNTDMTNLRVLFKGRVRHVQWRTEGGQRALAPPWAIKNYFL
jgi:hypothetical protein